MSRPGTEGSKRALDLVGRRLMGRYLVKQWIARGGMAVVFMGEDERLHRPVCVKLFFGFDAGQPEYAVVLEHFVQEAFALSRLQHPSTLRIYDFGYRDEVARTEPFFVTEYADGGHLGKLVADTGGLPPREVLRLLRPIIGALNEAHAADIVHRDLKPSNILLTSAGGELSPKLADFSIAKAQGDLPNRASETNAQAPLYSLSWAAPEQLSGGRIGPAADIFALGLLAAHMLTETLVYPGDDVMALYSLRSEGPEYRQRAIAALGLPEPIEGVVLTACDEAPARRHASVDAFYDALVTAIEATEARDTEPASPIVTEEADDAPTEQHALLAAGPPPGLAPSASSVVAPQLLPPVSPPDPVQQRQPPAKPRLRLATLDVGQIVAGNRRVRILEADEEPVTLSGALAGRPARLRVTPVELAHGHVHLKGLNCFLRRLDGRPSSGLDVDRPRTLELLDPQSGATCELRVVLGTCPDGSHELELSDAIISLPASLARWAVVLDAGSGTDTVLLFSRSP